MAARENQGLQIALIIFVVLTIALAVSTFMFFSKFDEERNKIAQYEKEAKDATAQASEALTEGKELKRILGAAAGDSLKMIQEAQKKDFTELNPGMAEDKQNYRALAMQLDKTLKDAQANLIAAQEREKKLGDKIKVDETTKVGEIKEYKTSVDTAATDYGEERGKLTADVKAAAEAKNEAQQKFDNQKKSFDDTNIKLKSEIQDLQSQIVKLTQVIDKLTEDRLKEEQELEVADGQVRWVNQGQQLVWLDKGSADGLRQQVSFKVIDRDEPNPATAPTKATIEVIRVTDGHSSEARIVTDDPANPIMPGDVLFSTAWQPGRIEHFAIAGFMDVNSDGVSDRELVKQLVTVNRGVIDAEVTDDGKMVGNMDVGTKYLIMGDRPTDKNLTPEMQKSYTRAIEQARKLGIKQMSVAKFLDYIGYEPEQRTVALDGDARPDDFKARMPDVPRKSIGKTIDYTPIRPKPKKTTY